MSKISFVTGCTAYVKDNLLIIREGSSSYFKFAKLDITEDEVNLLMTSTRYNYENVMGPEFKKFINAFCSIYDMYSDFSIQFIYDGEKYIMPHVYSYANFMTASRNVSWQTYLESNGFTKIDTAYFNFNNINNSFTLKEGEEFDPNYEINLNNFFNEKVGFGNTNTNIYFYKGKECTFMDIFSEPFGACYRVGNDVYKFCEGIKCDPLSKCEITGRYLDNYSILRIIADREYKVSKYTLYIGFDNVYYAKEEYRNDYINKIGYSCFVKCAYSRCLYKVTDVIEFNSNYGISYISMPSYDEGYRVCYDCGNYYNVFDDYDTDNAEDDIYEDRHYCKDCNPSINRLKINNYSYKPLPNFYGTGPMYFGVELEVGNSNNARELCRGLARIGEIEKLMYAKRDGSLCEEGVELVTHPCSYNYHMNDFPWEDICDVIYDYDGTNIGAGLHIHMSRNAMSASTQKRIVYFINRYPKFFTAFARRSEDEVLDWCNFIGTNITATTYSKALNTLFENAESSSRYTATNLQNINTIEVRIFKADYDESYIRRCIDILNGIYLMANSVDKDEDFCKMTVSDLTAFVNEDTADEIDALSSFADEDIRNNVINIIIPAESLVIGNKYFIRKSNISTRSYTSGYYNPYNYNCIYFALKHIRENPLKECMLIHEFELDNIKYCVFHSSCRFANNERWDSRKSFSNEAFINALEDKGISEDIKEAAMSRGWDKSARVMILPADIITAKEVR